MNPKFDLTNKRFGRLIVIKQEGKNKRGVNYWLCKCDCGNFVKVIRHRLTLRKKPTKSCGCLHRDMASKANKIHGEINTKFYTIWEAMKARCNNSKHRAYKNYGGRGITYDPRWKDYLNFRKDMYFKYLYAKRQLKIKRPSIERIDVNGNYCFDNCCFIELKDQGKNKRGGNWFIATNTVTNEKVKMNNQTKFAEKYKLSQANISACLLGKRNIHKGWKFKFIK